ncbi:MAG TPA: DUF2339 domain-containing protein, partial [Bacteroidota bacterium]|nr:DUF2339 domain-containing protein [Bacteroidota bacterium]
MIGFLTMLVLASFVVLIVLFTRVSALAEKIRELEWELRNLRKRLAQIPSVAEAAPAAPPAPVASPTSPPVPLTPSPLPGAPSTPYPIVPEQARPHLPEKAPSRTREEFEAFVGGKLLNRIGALALVIGVGFFLKYAFDNNWITETMRVVLGFVAGIAVLFTAVRTHRKGFQIFAQGLFGAGIAILYLTVYASFNFYHLVSQAVAFGMMGAVTVTAIGFAFKYDSLAISLLAWAGGFLTPFLLSTGHANEAGLFTYIGLLEAGLIAVAFRKPAWAILEALTLGGTYLVFYAWYDQYYADDTLALTVFFLSAFWALFFFSDVIRTARGIAVQSQLRQLTGILNVSCYYGFMYDVVNRMHHDWMGLTTLLICLAYLLHVILMMRRPSEDATLVGQNVLTAIILLAAATWIQYSGFTTVIFWSIEAVGLVWCSVRWNMRYVYIAAAGLLGIALIKLADTSGAFSFDKPEQFTLLLNYRALTYLSLAAAAGMSAVLLNRHVYREIPALRAILHAAWCAVLFTFVTVETNDWFTQRALGMNLSESLHMNYREMMTLLCCWTLYS